MKKYRIVNKERFITFLIITILLISNLIIFFSNSKVYSSTYKESYEEILVKNGDTLWNIALNNMPENYDVRKMVFEIREFNNLNNANIYPGDLLKIPVKHNPN